MKVYLLNQYEEHGPDSIFATLDETKLAPHIEKMNAGWNVQEDRTAENMRRLNLALDGKNRFGDPTDDTSQELSDGWGGWQLHIVELA